MIPISIPAGTNSQPSEGPVVDAHRAALERMLHLHLDQLLQAEDARPPTAGVPPATWDVRYEPWARTRNALEALSRLLRPAVGSADITAFPGLRSGLLAPVYAEDDHGSIHVTSLAMLSVQACLLSHLGWSESHQPRIVSGFRAYAYLRQSAVPEELARVVGFLIMMKDAVRNCQGPQKEVFVWHRKALVETDEQVIPALSSAIQSAWPHVESRQHAMASLVFLAAGYQQRFSSLSDPSAVEPLARTWRSLNSRAGDANNEADIVVMVEYLHYWWDGGDASQKRAIQSKLSDFINKQDATTGGRMLNVSLGRYLSDVERRSSAKLFEASEISEVAKATEIDPAAQAWSPQRLEFAQLTLEPNQRFVVLYGCEPPTRVSQPEDAKKKNADQYIWQVCAAAFKKSMTSSTPDQQSVPTKPSPSERYLPWPLIYFSLVSLAKIFPECFSTARATWGWCRDPEFAGRSFTIPLPKSSPDPGIVEQCLRALQGNSESGLPTGGWPGKNAREDGEWAQYLVANFAAAWVLNLRMAIGQGALRFMFDGRREVEAKYRQAINKIDNYHHYDGLRCYLTQVGTESHPGVFLRPRSVADEYYRKLVEQLMSGPAGGSSPLALGIDVGGTEIKVSLFRLSYVNGEFRIVASLGEPKHFLTTVPGDPKHVDGAAFGEYLVKCFHGPKGFHESGDVDVWDQIVAVGVTWPGAVGGPAGAEVINGPSGILANFVQNPWDISRDTCLNNPIALHKIAHDLRTYLWEKLLSKKDEDLTVRMINDGDAQTYGASPLASAESFGSMVVVAVGTGTALGLIYGHSRPRLAPVLAEAGKIVVNLFARVKEENCFFPEGVANSVASIKALEELANAQIDSKLLLGKSFKMLSIEVGIILQQVTQLLEDESLIQIQETLKNRWEEAKSKACDEAKLDKPRHKNLKWKDREALLVQSVASRGDHADEEFAQALDDLEEKWVGKTFNRTAQFGPLHKRMLVAARQFGQLLADVIATSVDLFDSDAAMATGGVLSGATGRLVRAFARSTLAKQYGFECRESARDLRKTPRRIRPLQLLEPKSQVTLKGGAFGAALLAVDTLNERLKMTEKLDAARNLQAELDEPGGARIVLAVPSESNERAGVKLSIRLADATDEIRDRPSKSYYFVSATELLAYLRGLPNLRSSDPGYGIVFAKAGADPMMRR